MSRHLPQADGELWSLVEAFVEGTATMTERDSLEARIRAEPQARWFYVAYLDLHAQLQWRMRGESAPAVVSDQPRLPIPKKRSYARRKPRPLARALVAAVVLVAVGFFTLGLVQHFGSDEGEPPELPDAPAGSVAVLIDDRNTVWERDMAMPTESGSALGPGRLKLKAGVAAIAFLGGGEVLLEGPADFDVSAPDGGHLHRGKLTAKVADGGPALRMSTPGVVVTDRRGECGLMRDESGCTEVHVFDGDVGAGPTDATGQRLVENAAVRFDPDGRTITPVPINQSAFAHLRPDIRVIDAAVRAGQFSGNNFGTRSRLMVKNSIADYTWETYLCFDLAGIKGKVSEARVRLVPIRVGQSFANSAALALDNLWNEATITWDKKPASGPAFATWTVAERVPVEFDVTRFVHEALAGDKKLSLRIFAPEFKRYKNFVEYGSRKGEAETRPQLLITIVQ
jgi:hypothetical protein